MGSLALLVVFLRLFFRLHVSPTPFDLDDHALHVAVLLAIVVMALNESPAYATGISRSVWTLSWEQTVAFMKYVYAQRCLYFAYTIIIKLAMLFFFRRIFPDSHARRLIWATVVMNVVGGLVVLFIALFQCSPIEYWWTRLDDETRTAGHCLSDTAIA